MIQWESWGVIHQSEGAVAYHVTPISANMNGLIVQLLRGFPDYLSNMIKQSIRQLELISSKVRAGSGSRHI